MRDAAANRRKVRFLPISCLAITIGLLLAGLWPFNFRQRNNVSWIEGQRGLRFDRHGIAFVKEPIFGKDGAINLAKPFTFFLELRPSEEPDAFLPRILSAYDDRGRELFLLGQWKSNLILRILEEERYFHLRYREIGVENFHKSAMRSIVLSSDGDTLAISSDVTHVETMPGVNFSLLSRDQVPAWLIVGNSPSGDSTWRGDLLSFSIYPKALSPGEMESAGIEPVIQYRFAEGAGEICRGGIDPRYDLVVPALFRAPGKGVLVPPWRMEKYDRSFWKDMFVNILGFIPFGFAVYAWVRKNGERERPWAILAVVLLGSGISLFIEAAQVYLPTRDSSSVDVMNNILGTYLGVLLFRKAHRVLIDGTTEMVRF